MINSWNNYFYLFYVKIYSYHCIYNKKQKTNIIFKKMILINKNNSLFSSSSSPSCIHVESLFPIQPSVTIRDICDCSCCIPLIFHKFSEPAVKYNSTTIFCSRQHKEARTSGTTESNYVQRSEVSRWRVGSNFWITNCDTLVKIVNSCSYQMWCELTWFESTSCF